MAQFSIIGNGNMAWFLATKLSEAGHQLLGVFARNQEYAKAMIDQFGGQVFATANAIADAENHVCFIAVADNAILEIANQLDFQKTILVHTSGANGINILANAARKTAVFWCIYSIQQKNIATYQNIPIAIQASEEQTKSLILDLAQSISSNAFSISESQGLQLHVAAVFANNFTNHLLAIAQEICAAENINFEYLQPIIAQTFEQIKNGSPKERQTGPARRGDQKTIEKHLAVLNKNKDWNDLYQSITDSITKMYSPIER